MEYSLVHYTTLVFKPVPKQAKISTILLYPDKTKIAKQGLGGPRSNRLGDSLKFEEFFSKNVGPISEKLVFNSVLNFRRVAHFWLCLLETQGTVEGCFLFAIYGKSGATLQTLSSVG